MKTIARVTLAFFALLTISNLAMSQSQRETGTATQEPQTKPNEQRYVIPDRDAQPAGQQQLTEEEVLQMKQEYTRSQADLDNYQGTSSDDRTNQLMHEMIVLRANLAKGRAEGTLSQAQVEKYEKAIALLQNEIVMRADRERVRMNQQNTQSAPQTRAENKVYESRPLTPAEVELKNFKADSPIQEVNDKRYEILVLKAEMQSGRLSAAEKTEYQEKISAMEADLQAHGSK